MVSMKKTNVHVIKVTADINGERVVVGETTIVAIPEAATGILIEVVPEIMVEVVPEITPNVIVDVVPEIITDIIVDDVPDDKVKNKDNDVPEIAQIHLAMSEGLTMEEASNHGLENAISVSSSKSELINKVAERNKKTKEVT